MAWWFRWSWGGGSDKGWGGGSDGGWRGGSDGGGVVVQMGAGVVVQMEVGWLFRWVRAADSDGGGVVVQMGVVQVGMAVQMRGGLEWWFRWGWGSGCKIGNRWDVEL